MHSYTLYGINITSDGPLLDGGCENSAVWGTGKNTLDIISLPAGESSYCQHIIDSLELSRGHQLRLYSDQKTLSNEIGRRWCMEVKGIVRFSWVGGEPTLFYQILPQGSVHRMAYWCVHMVLPMFKAFTQGWHFFHASSVEVAGGAVLFVAPSYGGKSTLAHHAVLRGARLLSDDKVRVRREASGYCVVPSHPCSRPNRVVESLGKPVANYSDEPAPLLAVYCLEQSGSGTKAEISELVSFKKLESLLQHQLYGFPAQRREQLAFLAGMVEHVPVFTFTRPWGLNNMPMILDSLEHHMGLLQDNSGI